MGKRLTDLGLIHPDDLPLLEEAAARRRRQPHTSSFR